ncbi:MAG: Gfo/Idh/MocA family oxidoreductase, partial [Acidimicrobiales bacterium]
ARLDLAARLGASQVSSAETAAAVAQDFAGGRGVDGVIVAASSRSSDPIHQAAVMCRQRGRIVLVGVTGLELDRADFYEKELSFQVSCSYGPGRYDPSYEDRATDYPFGLVRWTAGRNMAAALDMMASGRLDTASLLTHRFPLAEAARAYETLGSDRSALGIVLNYPPAEAVSTEAMLVPTVSPSPPRAARPASSGPRVGVIGAGAFATRVMLPALRAAGGDLVAIAGRGGPSASVAARQFGAGRATNDPASVIEAPDVDVVFVFTRHDSHAPWVEAALAAGKHVFVEKPLAIDARGLETVIAAREEALARGAAPLVGVGFNRRFAPVTQRMVQLLDATPGPRAIDILVNAGPIPASHWTQDPAVGGGRLLGEGCHFIDLARFLAGSPITGVRATALGSGVGGESASVTLSHADG